MTIHEMTLEECRHELSQCRFGRLACSREDQPYVVPIHFAFDGKHVYSFSMLGQKIEWMRENPLVCLEVDSVTSPDDWTSVLVFGRYAELEEPDEHTERVHAHGLLQRRAMWWQPGSGPVANAGRHADVGPIFFRISVSKLTGHRAVPDEDDATRATSQP